MAATEEWVYQNHLGASRSPVILTSVELEAELAQRKSSLDEKVVSVFDGLLGKTLGYLQLTRFYVIRETEIRAWYIPVCQAVSM